MLNRVSALCTDFGAPKEGQNAKLGLFTVLFLAIAVAAGHAQDLLVVPIEPPARVVDTNRVEADFYDVPMSSIFSMERRYHASSFEVTTQFISVVSDSRLVRLLAALKRRNITFSVAALPLSGRGGCGAGVEGFSAPLTMQTISNRVEKTGHNIDYLVMDEPLWYGRYYSGKSSCQLSVAEILRDISPKLAAVRHIFPSIAFGDIEPVGATGVAHWELKLIEWLESYKVVMGQPLDSFRADIQWQGDWERQIKILRNYLHHEGIKLSIIINGDPTDDSDVSWVRRAQARRAKIELDPDLVPDQFVVQTWDHHPTRNLPEDEPGTLMWLAKLGLCRPH